MSVKFALSTFAPGLLALFLTSGRALAVTPTTSFSVTATVQATCLVSATTLTFGTYTGTSVNGTSTVSVTCTDATPFNVGLNPGLATGATVTNRKLTGPGSALLGYSLFSNSQETVNWGQTVGVDTVAGIGNGSAQTLAVYGHIPAGQCVAPGAYADTITVTVTY